MRSLEDAEQRLADARVNSAADKSGKKVPQHKRNRNQMTSKKNSMVEAQMTDKIQERELDRCELKT